MNIERIIHVLKASLHPELQEKYDNSGPQIIFRETDVSSIMISLDLDSAVLDEAIKKKCGLIISHHPLFFNELRSIDTGDPGSSLIVKIVDERINVYSAHTNLDKLFYDRLATILGFGNIEPLFPYEPSPGGIAAGFGALVNLEKPVVLQDLLAEVRKALNLEYIAYTGDCGKEVSRIAVLNGAGGRSIEKIIRERAADCIITGDVGYHQAKYAADRGTAVLDAGHFGTEVVLLGFLRDRVVDCLTKEDPAAVIPIYISESEKNPLRIYGRDNE